MKEKAGLLTGITPENHTLPSLVELIVTAEWESVHEVAEAIHISNETCQRILSDELNE